MGRKLIGLVIGFTLTIVLAFIFFPPQYDAIIRWLSPYLGPWLRFAFIFLFIIFADCLAYPNVLITWVAVGLVAGLLCRSHWGAIPVAILIFTLSFLMMIIGFANTIISLLISGGFDPELFLVMFTAVPPDVSILDILNAPVIGPILSVIMENLSDLMSGAIPGIGTGDIFSTIMGLMSFLSEAIIVIVMLAVRNLIILTVCGVIGGAIGRAILPPD